MAVDTRQVGTQCCHGKEHTTRRRRDRAPCQPSSWTGDGHADHEPEKRKADAGPGVPKKTAGDPREDLPHTGLWRSECHAADCPEHAENVRVGVPEVTRCRCRLASQAATAPCVMCAAAVRATWFVQVRSTIPWDAVRLSDGACRRRSDGELAAEVTGPSPPRDDVFATLRAHRHPRLMWRSSIPHDSEAESIICRIAANRARQPTAGVDLERERVAQSRAGTKFSNRSVGRGEIEFISRCRFRVDFKECMALVMVFRRIEKTDRHLLARLQRQRIDPDSPTFRPTAVDAAVHVKEARRAIVKGATDIHDHQLHPIQSDGRNCLTIYIDSKRRHVHDPEVNTTLVAPPNRLQRDRAEDEEECAIIKFASLR